MFKRQDWRDKELLVATDQVTPDLEELVASSSGVRLLPLPLGLSLGEYRNLAISRASGDYVCQWDDDDWYDSRRISLQVKALEEAGSDAVFLSQWLIWWQARSLLFLSHQRIWEGSILARRSALPIYPAMEKGEDSAAIAFMLRHSKVSLMDAPSLYCYCVTGQNTYADSHFEGFLRRAAYVFTRAQFAEAFRSLDCLRLARNII